MSSPLKAAHGEYPILKISFLFLRYRMNDEEVTRVGVDHVLSQSAYMLVYERGTQSKADKKASIINNFKKEIPVNSTISWNVKKPVLTRANSTLLNSTMDFRVVETLVNDDTVRISVDSIRMPKDTVRISVDSIRMPKDTVRIHEDTVSLPKDTARVHEDTVRIPEVTNVKLENLNEKYPKSVASGKQNITTSFLEEMKKDESYLPTWNHIATTDKAFKKRIFLEEQSRNEKLKRKRASRDDIEYDAPKRKGFKKMNERQNFNDQRIFSSI